MLNTTDIEHKTIAPSTLSVIHWALDNEERGGRYELRESLVHQGYRYWGDGRIAIRVPSVDADTLDFRVPDFTRLPWPSENIEMKLWPAQPEQIFYDKDSDRSFYDSFAPATLVEVAMLIDGMLISPRYFAIISELQGATYCVNREKDCFFVRYGEIEALVMCMDGKHLSGVVKTIEVPSSELPEATLKK